MSQIVASELTVVVQIIELIKPDVTVKQEKKTLEPTVACIVTNKQYMLVPFTTPNNIYTVNNTAYFI